MSKFDELFGEQQAQKPAAGPRPEIIYGTFVCDTHGCWEYIDEAEYYRLDKRLVFKHDDHVSVIEGFVL